MITKILVALDDSERTQHVADVAADLAQRLRATLYPLRVIDVPPEFPPAARASHADPLPGHMAAIAIAAMRKLFASATDVRVEGPTVKIGVPWRRIVEASEELDVDLIVVGSHGYHGLDRLLGTTAGRVANLAHRHVFVVHNRGVSAIDGPATG